MTGMGKGSTKSEVQHAKQRDDGRAGCWSCGKLATRWMDMERYGIRRWLSTAYCDEHGDWESDQAGHKERRIKEVGQ
ncbi:hypothetical protein [Streptomyces sp. NPDC002790]|uniref:hypothetical protein n=1 Tax=Streptomyces sp. NPDC002790 TaxID=3154431 RepID=UPI0033203F85